MRNLVLQLFITILAINLAHLDIINGKVNKIKCEMEAKTFYTGDKIIWPEVIINSDDDEEFREVTSTPICLDEYKMPITRKCENTNGWQPRNPPQCNYLQHNFEQINKCPPGYIQLMNVEKTEFICIFITHHQKWNETCLPSGSSSNLLELPTIQREMVLKYLADNHMDRVWIPAKRPDTLLPVLWRLPGEKWGEPIEFDEHDIQLYDDQFNGDCLSVNITTQPMTGYIENCNNYYPILCVYNQESTLQLACPDDSFTTRYEYFQDYCVYIDKDSTHCLDNDLFTPATAEKVEFYRVISNYYNLDDKDLCATNLLSNANMEDTTSEFNLYNWINHMNDIEFINWSSNISSGSQMAINRRGEWLLTNHINCASCVQKLTIKKPEIYLKFDEARGRLFLILYSKEFLWRVNDKNAGVTCFTNSDNELLKIVQIKDIIWTNKIDTEEILPQNRDDTDNNKRFISKSIYELKLTGDGPGYYWCEGHSIPNFKLIHSNKIVSYKKLKGAVFSVMAKVKCLNKCNKIYNKKYLKQIVRDFKHELNQQTIFLKSNNYRMYRRQKKAFYLIKNIKIMKIESIDVSTSTLVVLFHVTMSLDDEAIEEFIMNANLNNNYNPQNDSSESETSAEDEIDELGVPPHIYKLYRLKYLLNNLLLLTKSTYFEYMSLNNTEYCLPESLTIINEFNWVSAKIGETSVPKELCLLDNGLPITRKCVGDFIYGGMWQNLNTNNNANNYCDKDKVTPITEQLYQLGTTIQDNSINIMRNLTEIVSNSSNLIPADLFYLGRIMQTIATTDNCTDSTDEEANDVATLINNVMYVNESVARISQSTLNSTNSLLDSFDNIINKMPFNLTKARILTEDGTITAYTPKLIVFMADPSIKNISGVGVFRNTTKWEQNFTAGDFSDYYLKPIYLNQSAIELLIEDNLEVGAFLPINLIQRIDEINDTTLDAMTTTAQIKPPIRVVITIFYNDRLFQENKNISYAKTDSRIISVSIPGHGPDLPALIPIYFRGKNNSRKQNSMCGYWNFSPNDTTKTGEWAKDGCDYMGKSNNTEPVIVCGCSHLTHFAYLVLGTYTHSVHTWEDDVIITETHQEALDLITLLGCSLSLIGIFGIAATAISFPTWREKAGSKVLLQLSAAIALQMILMCFVNTETITVNLVEGEKWNKCIALGAFLHYSVLVAFSWMLITAYLQFMRYVKVLGHTRPSRFFLKSFLLGWFSPLVPVLLVVIITPESYIPPINIIYSSICYPSGYALYIAVLLPVALIIGANLIIFILVIYNILRGPDGKIRIQERDLSLSQLRLSIFLFFLLGLSWLFGLAATSKISVIFSYLFCLTATLQGFVLFIYFIIMDPITRKLWTDVFNKIGFKCFTNKI